MEEERQCRYCLDEHGSSEDLVAPCACDGGQRWVHLECLRRWQVAVRLEEEPPLEASDSSRAFVCNICLQRFSYAPPTRHEALRHLVGVIVADLIKSGNLVVASPRSSSFHLAAVRGIASPRPTSISNAVHLSRAVYLIYNVTPKQRSIEIFDESSRSAFLQFMDPLDHVLVLDGVRFRLLNMEQLTVQTDTSSDSGDTSQGLCQTLRSVNLPVRLCLEEEESNRGMDMVFAVNLCRPITEKDLSAMIGIVYQSALQAAHYSLKQKGYTASSISSALNSIHVLHFLGGIFDSSTCVVVFPIPKDVLTGQDFPDAFTCLESANLAYNDNLALALHTLAESLMDSIKSAENQNRELEKDGASREYRDSFPSDPATSDDAPCLPRALKLARKAEIRANNAPAVPTPEQAAASSTDGDQRSHVERPFNVQGSSLPLSLYVFWGQARWSRMQLLEEVASGTWGLCEGYIDDLAAQPAEFNGETAGIVFAADLADAPGNHLWHRLCVSRARFVDQAV